MRFLVVANEHEPCPYLPSETMRLPLRLPLGGVSPEDFDRLLEEGDRRMGPLLYRPQCPVCSACEAIRVPVDRFQPTRSQRRAWKRNEAEVRHEWHAPTASPRHLELYNKHKMLRGLMLREGPTDIDGYRMFLVESCVDTRELRYFVGDELVAVSVLDFGRRSVSSVYHYFDPDQAWRSLGVYSVLKEIALCREAGIEWYYLGLYVKDCDRLNYKAAYHPHQRRARGHWREFANADEDR